MNSNAELLRQLKIDKSHKEAHGGGGGKGPRLALIMAGVVVALLAVGAGACCFLSHPPVH